MKRRAPEDPHVVLERAYRLQLDALDALRNASAATLAAARRLELDAASLARAKDDGLAEVRRERLVAEIATLRERHAGIDAAATRLAARVALFRTERAALEARLASYAAGAHAGGRLAALDAALGDATRDVAAARAELARAVPPTLERAADDAFALEDVATRRRLGRA